MKKDKTQKPKKTTKSSKKNTDIKAKKTSQEPIIIANTIFELTIPWKKVEPTYKKALKKATKNLKLDGFRVGKVPVDIAKKHLDTTRVIETALSEVIPDIYLAEIKRRKLRPLTTPRITPITLAEGNDVVVKVEIAEKPEIKLKDYKKIVKKAKKEAEKSHKDGKEKGQKLDEKHLLDHVYAALIQELRPQVPELLITREVEFQLDDLIQKLKRAGMSFDFYLKQMGVDQRTLANNLATQAVGKMQLMFILDEIAKKEQFEVSEKELDEYFEKKADESMQAHSKDPNYRQYVKELLLRDKMVKHLLEV